MASSFDDVRRSLRSEKVTERAKAKQKCEELLQKCKIEIIGSNTDWTELLRASIDYEAKEVENDQQKKTKTNSIDACSFLYKILKFCCVNNLFHPKRCYEVLFHSIRILHDPISTNQYKSIHKTIVSELLDVRLCASQKSSYFVEVFELLKQLMKDRAGVSDSANLRLFKRFCKALYTDESRNDDMALSIICTCESEWYRLVAEDLAQLSAVASSFADGFSYLLEYNDLNGIEDILGALVNSIPIFIRQISTSQHRDNQRSPYLRFFDAYMNILTRAMQLTQRRSLLPCNLLLHLDLLITIFTSEDQLCPVLALSAGQSIGPQKALRDIFTEPLEDSKIKLYFDVAAHICWFGHIKRIEDTASSSLSIIRRLLNKVSELCERDETLNSLSNQERYLLEGNLLLLGQIFRLSASLQKILTQLQSAIFPVSILLSYTRTLSQVLSVCWRNNNFAQVKAACIHALRGLFVLGSDCMQTIPYHTSTSISSLSTHHDTQCLKDVWRGVIEVLLTESSPWRSVNAFRSRSLADAAIDIIEDIMRHDGLLGDSDKWLLQKRLWDFLLLHPIVNIESPRYFRLLALVVRNPDFESTRRLASILGPPVEPSSVKLILMSSSTASPRCVDDKSSQMVALIATWIKTRLTDTAAAKNSISSMKSVQEFIAAFSTLLNSVFGHCDSPIASDNIKATRKHLMVPSDANRVTDHEYSSAEISFAHLPSISSIDTSTNVIGETYPMSFQIVEGIMETVESVIAHLASRQEGEGFESPSSSQAGALLTLSVLSTLYSFVPNHNTVLSSAISNRVWCLLTSILQSMRISQDSNKWEPLSEFVVLLIAQLKPIKDILGHEALPPDNNECRQLLLSIITSVRNECLPGHITAGVKKSAANRFLSQSPDTSIDQPVLKKPKLTVVPIVDDDDFFDDDLKPSDSSPIKATKSGGEKKLCLSIAPEQMELIGNLTCLLLLLGTTWDEQNSSLNDVRELYTKFVNPFNESRQGNLFVKPELLLLLADTVSEDYFLPKTQVLVDAADWANDWGCLGTLKVLQYIKYSLQYISRHGLQAVSDFVERVGDWDTLVDFFITVALNQGKATQIHFAMYWRLREIQLQCVALLLQLHMLSEDELIDEARAVFIDGLIDPDIRVRMEASKLVSVLVTMSKNPHRLYATLVKNIDIPMVFERKHEDAWRVVTALATIATIGATNEETLPLCLFDLIRMCLTRYKKVKGGDAERKSERTIFVCYNDLLAHILNALRHRYEFQAPQLLVKDYFRYLFSRWIQIRGDEESLPLLSFPFYLFVDNKQTTGADLMKYSSTDFLGKFRSLIVPLVCQVSDGAYRKKLLDECLGDLPTHHSDTAVAQLLRDNYFAIQATETVLSISAHDNAMGRLENASACRKVLANTSQFVTRCIESNSQEEPAVSSQISDVVQALVDIIAMIPVDEFEADAKMTIAKGLKIIDNSRAAVPKSVISSATKSQGKASSSAAVPSLLSCCNPLALISSLHTRLFETRSPVLARSILQGLFALVDIIPIEYSSWTFAHSIIHIIYASLRSNSRRFTLAAPVLFNGLVCLVEKLTILPITPQVSSRYKGFSEQATRNVRTILRELWTLAVYCHYLTREDHTRMKGFDLDLFVLVSQSTAEDKVIVRESLDALLAPLVTVSRNAELHLTVTFAIPESLHQILSPGMRNAIESCFHSGSDEDILQQFFESATAFLRDGLCPFALLWLQLLHVEGLFSSESTAHSTFSDVMMSKIAAHILALGCADDNISSIQKLKPSVRQSLNRVVTSILGCIGPPDVYSLAHDVLPSRPGNVLLSSGGNVSKLKELAVMRLYSCLWLQPELGQHALAAMNELGRCDALLDLDSYQSAELRDFIFSFTENASTNPVVEFNTEMNPLNIWDDTLWSSRNISFRIWLPCLVSSLIRAWFSVDGPLSNAFIKSFQCIASLSVDVAEALLPLIIFEASVLGGDLRVRLVEVFTNHLLVPTGSTRAVQLACDTLTFLLRQEINSFSAKKRSQTEKYSHKAGPFFKLLPVDCTIVARAALSCGYHCTALLFTEFGHDAKKTTPDSDLLLSIQLGIHDPDGIFAINSSSLAVQAAQYADSGNWLEAMCAYESLMTNSRQANVSGMGTTQVESYIGLASSLRGLGCESSLHSLAYSLPTEVIKHHAGIAALASESSWRQFEASNHIGDPVRVSKDLSTWSLPSSATNSLSNQADENILFFNHSLSEMLRSTSAPGHASDTVWDKNFQSSGEVLLHQLRFVSTHESARRIIDHLSRAQQIFELKKLKESFHSGRLGKTHNILNTWTNKVTGLTSEPVLALRLTIAKQLLESGIESPEMVTNKAMDLILAAAVSPTASHSLSASVERLRQSVFSSLNKQNSPANEIECVVVRSTWALQEAKFLWKKGLHQTARATIDEDVIAFVKGSSTQTSTSPLADLLSEALRIRGEWAISSKVASGAAIAHQFLYPALEHSVDPVVRSKAAESLGEFNARLYRSIKARVGGLEWQQSEKVRADRRAELERCKIIISTEKEKNSGREASEEFKQLIRHTQVLHKETDMDEKDRRQIISTIHQYLHQAIENLVILLELSPDSNLDQIVQLVNLWLENKRSDDVNSLMRRAVDSVPTFKFIPLTYQIFSRLGDSDDSAADKTFQDVLQRLVYKMCEDHPHHTLWQLFALANADKVTSAAYKSNVSASRCAAATAILSRLRGSGSRQKLQTIVASIESLINSYIVLAEMSVEKYIKSNDIKNIPFRNFYDRSKVSFDSVGQGICPPTLLPRLRPDKDYDDIVRILQFSPTFSITDSGISRPKILEFTSTDYCKHRQLLKSGDDTRQDAVMEQVFEVVNKLLVAQESTRKRQLSIRTYKVVPLTPLIGVLQWVDNTIQFGAYLSDKGTGAHSRYNKFDWHHNDCREHLRNASSDDPNDRVKRMNEIYDRFKPAFKYFFLEHYASPTEWVSRRLAYTRSVAVTSIVGYILGIGDRHSHNILIDTLTAEVVHIDFGIVFDQGKGLSTPESVPFRLTRDIVDGMGIFRTEGAFRKCCEEVMRVLRSNSMALLTVLSVVIHDPLYKWSLSPAAARARQSKDPGPRMRAGQDAMEETGRSQFGRDAGERTLLRIKAKLQGFDDPTGEGLSVEGQVDQLISEAQSIENLSRLFPGWAPWL